MGAAADQARRAAGSGDLAVFVDSASTDDSAAVAQASGLEVWPAPLGKGAAIKVALRHVTTPWLVLLDADIFGSENNLAASLMGAVRRQPDVGMVVGDFSDPEPGGVLSNTWGIYEPLIEALFPEIHGTCGSKPLSGFRALRVDTISEIDRLPDDFGIEAWLNVEVGVGRRAIETEQIGWYRGRFLYKPLMGREIAAGVLDAAQRWDRIDVGDRPAWEKWVETVVEVVGSYRGDPETRENFLEELTRARERALPQPNPALDAGSSSGDLS